MNNPYIRIGEDLERAPLVGAATPRNIEVNPTSPTKKSYFAQIGAFFILLSAFGCYHYKSSSSSPTILFNSDLMTSKVPRKFDSFGRYIMRDFDVSKPMSNFLAGLGGLWGVPMWTFYVNRGQGIAAFGVQNKDGAIMKFSTAEKAYLITPFTGFRTFVKGVRGNYKFATMPFFPLGPNIPRPARNMMIGQNEMEIEEIDYDNNLQTNVLYFTIPDDEFPGLVRQTTFTNIGTGALHLEVLDGLGKLVPAGLTNTALDSIGRTMEGNYNDKTQPFFHVSQGTADTAQVQIIKEGHFVVSYIEGQLNTPIQPAKSGHAATSEINNELYELLPIVVDPYVVFGTDTTLIDPSPFYSTPLEELLKKPQGTTSRTPCALAATRLNIPAGGSVTITSVYGHADSLEQFQGSFRDKVRTAGYTKLKRDAATAVVDSITTKVSTKTSSYLFDMYAEQSFLDNVLRGGMPLALGDPENPKIYHVYSRIHGDLERDYNNFQIEVTPFSQGPGNFRDVNQNRRLDVLVNPAVKDFNVRMFLSFVQADGFNVLNVASTNFKVPTEEIPSLISELSLTTALSVSTMKTLLDKPFRIGMLFKEMKALKVVSSLTNDEILQKILTSSIQEFAGSYNQNGYWADHWTYTMDLVDNFLAVYPDKEEELLWESEPIPFFFSPALVKPRSERYQVVNITGFNNTVVRVYSAVQQKEDLGYPTERKEAMSAIMKAPDFIADASGQGGYWQRANGTTSAFTVTAISKLFILAINKFSSLDQSGMGIEMEGGKPGWNDAMNGLPGIIGSGMPETYEMLRILNFVKAMATKHARGITLPIEFASFVTSLVNALEALQASTTDSTDEASDFAYWDASNNARETYRKAVATFFEGSTVEMSSTDLIYAIGLMQEKTQAGIDRALATNSGLSPSYFFHECTSFDEVGEKPVTAVPKKFLMHTLPLFLEGPARHLKVIPEVEKRREVFTKTRASALYDSYLKMFKISEPLKNMGQDVGRMMAFSPGWLENESIWLHMSYKFYLELIRGGLYDEFFAEIATGLVPFMPTEVYGRNPVEASSFIVSSAFPDENLIGTGFLARLSGSTAEYMSMWSVMMMGTNPFVVGFDGKLSLALRPVLAKWLFTTENTVSFTFLSSITVTYHNPSREDTWKILPKSAIVVLKDGSEITIDTPLAFPEDVAIKVRNLDAVSIDIMY